MRKKNILNREVYEDPERVFVWNRDSGSFRGWVSELKKDLPLVVEIGMGTGDFLLSQAELYPDCFFLGVEIKKDRVAKARQKSKIRQISNIAFLQCDARNLSRYDFPPVSMIYLLFPDPWPKKRHARRRLSAERFLTLYRSFLEKNGSLIMKTDDRDMCLFSREQFEAFGWTIVDTSDCFDTPEHEQSSYERRFLRKRKSIYFTRATPPRVE